MSLEDYSKNELWPVLIETVHSLVMYPSHKAYTRLVILLEKPETTPADLVARLKISLGEALVILHELDEERKTVS
jgi:transcription initiation factor IIE alpha subunit